MTQYSHIPHRHFLIVMSVAFLASSTMRQTLSADEEIEFTPPQIDVPEGFTVELVAGPPLVKYPMMGALDERGRLFLAESDGQNLGKEGLLEQKSRFVRMLEDTDGDGKFDKSTIFADQMVMPEGGLFHNGSLFIMSAPYLWRLDDTDDDGIADERRQLVGEMDLIGNANQHGPYLTPAGRLLFSGGTFGYNLVGSDGSGPGQGNWASVFSCNLDGGDLRVESQCGINPVEVEFTSEGEMIGTCAIFDRVGGRCDALVHWVHGGLYAERLREPNLKQTGRYLPAAVRWGQVAPSGLVRMRGNQFGAYYRDNLFACLYNTHEVMRIRLERLGATFRGEHEVFLSSTNTDFHPADILEDADGSLLLIDTGAWLTMGCPLSKDISHGSFGGIYRIRKTDANVPDDPRGLHLDWEHAPVRELVTRLDDARPIVRDRAVTSLVAHGNRTMSLLAKVLAKSESPRMRRLAVWVLARIGTIPARAVICTALTDEDPSTRQAAVHAVGILRETSAVERLKEIVVHDELPIRREAATALGLIGSSGAIRSLFESLRTVNDEFLEHALIYALIEIGDARELESGLADNSPIVQRGALIAIDQIASESLTRENVASLLATSDAELQQSALEVIAKHPTWGEEIIGLLKEALSAKEPSPAQRAIIVGAVTAFTDNESVQALTAEALAQAELSDETLLVLLEAIGRCERAQLPESWLSSIGRLLSHPNEDVRRQLLASLSSHDIKPLIEPLRAMAGDMAQSNGLRVAALSLVARSNAELHDDELQLLVEALKDESAAVDRLTAANAISAAVLSTAQLNRLLGTVREAGPLEISALLDAYGNSARNERVTGQEATDLGLALIESLMNSAGKDSLSTATVRQVFSHFPEDVVAVVAQQFPDSTGIDESQAAKLNFIETGIESGKPASGEHLFFSNRMACSGCHKINGRGGSVGPDLSHIAKVRTPRQLAEAILVPSATLANGFETYTIATHEGRVLTGLIRRESADAIYLVGTDGKELRALRAEIDEVRRSDVSIMPRGLDKQLTDEQFNDLIAYLVTLK